MPLGIVEDSEFDLELDKLDKNQSEPRAVIVDKGIPGRKNGDNGVPSALRKIIGEEAITNGRQAAIGIAEEFGISHDSADAYKNGATSLATFNEPNPSLQSHLAGIKEKIVQKATGKLDSALESITPDKLEDIKPRDAAGIAKDMSVIIRNMEPDSDDKPRIGPNYIFYSPRSRKEEDYETLQVDE